MKDKFIKVAGIKTHYREEGRGKPVVLVHGWGRTWPVGSSLKIISSRFRIIIPDLPGYGGTEPLTKKHTIKNQADFIFRFLQKLKLRNVILVGGSMGTMVCAVVANQNPSLIGRCVLFGAMSNFKKDAHKRARYAALFLTSLFATKLGRRLIKKGRLRLLFASFILLTLRLISVRKKRSALRKEARQFSQHHPPALLENATDFLKRSLDHHFKSLKVPATFIYGKGDEIVAQKERVSSLPKKAGIIYMEDLGHGGPREGGGKAFYEKVLEACG